MLSGKTIFFIELVLVHGAVLAWAVWELLSVRRSQRADRARHAEGQQPPHQG